MKATKKTKKFIRKIGRNYKKLSPPVKIWIWTFLAVILVMLITSVFLMTLKEYDNQLTNQECNELRISDVRYYLSLQEENNVLAFLYTYSESIKFLLLAVGIGWIFHGVGFRIF